MRPLRRWVEESLLKRKIWIIPIVVVVTAYGICYGTSSVINEDTNYFLIQSYVIRASMAREFATLKAGDELRPQYLPQYYAEAFLWFDVKPKDYFSVYLSSRHNKSLEWTDEGYKVRDMTNGKPLDIFARSDWKTIQALVRDCNELLTEKGRIACEFDSGCEYAETPFTTFLFNLAYLKYQSQRIGYRNGRYDLLKGDALSLQIDMYQLLNRNALVRLICYRLLTKATSTLTDREMKSPPLPPGVWDNRTYLPKTLTYTELHDFYNWYEGNWHECLERNLRVSIKWTDTGFKVRDLTSGEKIIFPHDQDLIDQALKELNYYQEKVNFSENFMVANYPMFLLSILRLYDVNLDWDKDTGKIIIVPGPTDPQRFFKMVAECTFVNDPSDTEYLKEHLTSWLEPEQK